MYRAWSFGQNRILNIACVGTHWSLRSVVDFKYHKIGIFKITISLDISVGCNIYNVGYESTFKKFGSGSIEWKNLTYEINEY